MNGPVVLSNECHECGLFHPPIPEGQKCPMAKQTTKDGSEIEYNGILSNIRNILASHIDSNNITKVKKMFSKLTIEFMKIVENYEEDNENNSDE